MSDEPKNVQENAASAEHEHSEKVNAPDPNPILTPAPQEEKAVQAKEPNPVVAPVPAEQSRGVPVWHYVVIAAAAIASAYLTVHFSH